jgi:thioester reductase-like protein
VEFPIYLHSIRVFLAHILKQHPKLKVTCIVRAENHGVAMERVKEALGNAGYWEDSYASSIHARKINQFF